jgi:hypothetical protein
VTLTILDFDEQLLSDAMRECIKQKIGFETFVANALRLFLNEPQQVAQASVDPSTILKTALVAARKLPSKKEFHLEDIIVASDWDRLTVGQRKILGKNFRKAVEISVPLFAEHTGRTNTNKAIYKRL